MVRETIEQFNKLQGLDSRIMEVEKKLATIPEMLKELRLQCDAIAEDKAKAEAEYGLCKADLLKIEATSADQKSLLANAQKKLTSVQNNKEYQAALKELDILRAGIADADAKIKQSGERLQELEELIKTKTTSNAEKEKEYLKEKEEKEGENKAFFDELAVLKKEREAFVATVKKSLLSKYERVRAARNNIAIVPISGEVCTGCYMKLPPQMAVEVKKERELLQCPYCQRFLYQPKVAAAEPKAS